MPAFLDDITPFYGTGEVNEDGLNLKDFLEEYDPYKYKNPSVTTDIIVFQVNGKLEQVENGLKLLMVKRKNHPCIGFWALPGGFVNIKEDTISAAKRELEEETSLTGVSMQQLYTWGEVWRDPRSRIVTVAYLALVNEDAMIQAGDDAAEAVWADVMFKKTGENVVIADGKERLEETFEIRLDEDVSGIHLKGIVKKSSNQNDLLEEEVYEVVHSDGIAFDHPRFIVQALLYLKDRMNKQI